MYQTVDFLTSLLTPINRTRDSGAPVQARNVVVQAFPLGFVAHVSSPGEIQGDLRIWRARGQQILSLRRGTRKVGETHASILGICFCFKVAGLFFVFSDRLSSFLNLTAKKKKTSTWSLKLHVLTACVSRKLPYLGLKSAKPKRSNLSCFWSSPGRVPIPSCRLTGKRAALPENSPNKVSTCWGHSKT